MTKNGKPHSLPVTPMMWEILERRCLLLEPDAELFKGLSAEHVHSMTMRLGAPRFMLHDLRKLVATVGEKLGLGDAVLRRILNHTAPMTDVLHRHYVGLSDGDVADGLANEAGSMTDFASIFYLTTTGCAFHWSKLCRTKSFRTPFFCSVANRASMACNLSAQ